MDIRVATLDDASRILEIYTPYVTDTAITFEYIPPTLDNFRERMRRTLDVYPYLVALDDDGRIIGYAYAGSFVRRAAYDWAVETTIYLDRDERHKGLGKKLYASLEHTLRAQNVLNLYACIAHAPVEDEYLTNNSEGFHAHLGYRMIGEFRACGCKFGRWYDIVWMEKHIGEHVGTPEPLIPFEPSLLRL